MKYFHLGVIFVLLFASFLEAQEGDNWFGCYEYMLVTNTNPYSKDRVLNEAEKRLATLIYDGLLLRHVREKQSSAFEIAQIRDKYSANLVEDWASVEKDDIVTFYFILRNDVRWSNSTRDKLTVRDIDRFYYHLQKRNPDLIQFDRFLNASQVPIDALGYVMTASEKRRSFGIRFHQEGAVSKSLFTYPILPESAFTGGWNNDKPVGTGRYKLVNVYEEEGDHELELQKNYGHHLFRRTKNNIDSIIIYCIPNIDVEFLVNSFRQGQQFNLIYKPTKYIRQGIESSMGSDDFSYFNFDTNNHHALVINRDKPYLQDERVRRALNMFCGREILEEEEGKGGRFEGRTVPWGSKLTKDMREELGRMSIGKKEALSLFYDAGYDTENNPGKPVVLVSRENSDVSFPSLKLLLIAEEGDVLDKVKKYMISSFKKIGVDAEVYPRPMKQMLQMIGEKQEGKSKGESLIDEDWDAFYWSFSTVGLSRFEELDHFNLVQHRSENTKVLEQELKALREKPGFGQYLESCKKVLSYCKDDPPFIELFKVSSELYSDPRLVIPDKLLSGRISLFAMVHQWHYGDGKALGK